MRRRRFPYPLLGNYSGDLFVLLNELPKGVPPRVWIGNEMAYSCLHIDEHGAMRRMNLYERDIGGPYEDVLTRKEEP